MMGENGGGELPDFRKRHRLPAERMPGHGHGLDPAADAEISDRIHASGRGMGRDRKARNEPEWELVFLFRSHPDRVLGLLPRKVG